MICKNCGLVIIKRRSHAKFCSRKCAVKWHNDNNPKVKIGNKINAFLYGSTKRLLGFLGGTGYCIICGENFPFLLNTHHIFGINDDLAISLCANHHNLVHRLGWKSALKINNKCYDDSFIEVEDNGI